MRTPRIGVTRGGSPDRIHPTYQKYHDRITEAGGETVDLHPERLDELDGLIESLDGLMLTGGPDVLPARFGEAPHPETDDGDPPRDALEFRALSLALTRDLPILAICRGQQVLNVALGGGLIQHIDGDGHRAHDGGRGDSRWHEVEIDPASILGTLLGEGRMETNSRHHQAVPADRLGDGLRVTATAPDGIVEAIEAPGQRWVVAVQWHPERPEVAERFRPLFQTFIAESTHTPAGVSAGT